MNLGFKFIRYCIPNYDPYHMDHILKLTFFNSEIPNDIEPIKSFVFNRSQSHTSTNRRLDKSSFDIFIDSDSFHSGFKFFFITFVFNFVSF